MRNYGCIARVSVAALFLAFCSDVLAAPGGVSFQGRVLRPDSTPLEAASVVFTFEVTDPSGSCALYEETQTLNMTGSNGVFSTTIGSGARTAGDPGLTLAQVFTNSGSIASLNCGSYTPAPGDTRNIYVVFDDGTELVSFASPYQIQSVPFALEADRLAGLGKNDLLQVTSDTTQIKLNDIMTPANYAELVALVNGTSTQYASDAGDNFTPSSAISFNTQKITDLADPTNAQDAATKSYSDSRIGGTAADSATIAALAPADSGKVLQWDGTQWTAATASATDSTKLPLDGSVAMSGNLDLGTNTISNASSVLATSASFTSVGIGSAGSGGLEMRSGINMSPDSGTTKYSIINLANPSSAQDAATKAYVDTQISGVSSTDSAAFHNAGDSFGAAATLGTNDNFALNFETNSSTAMTILPNGNVGIGAAGPGRRLHVAGPMRLDAAALPTTPAVGDIAIDSADVNKLKYYNGSSWIAAGASGGGSGDFLADGSIAMTGNLRLAANWLSNDGGNEGVSVTAGGVVTVGQDGGMFDGAFTNDPSLVIAKSGAGSTPYIGFLHTSNDTSMIGIDSGDYFTMASEASQNGIRFRVNGAYDSSQFIDDAPVAMTIDNQGDVGIGVSSIDDKLVVAGTIRNSDAISNATSIINFSSGNVQYTPNNCGSFALHNLKSGGIYTFGVQGTTSATCVFNAFSDAGTTALTIHMPGDHAATTAGKHTIYSLIVMGAHAYVSWVPGL